MTISFNDFARKQPQQQTAPLIVQSLSPIWGKPTYKLTLTSTGSQQLNTGLLQLIDTPQYRGLLLIFSTEQVAVAGYDREDLTEAMSIAVALGKELTVACGQELRHLMLNDDDHSMRAQLTYRADAYRQQLQGTEPAPTEQPHQSASSNSARARYADRQARLEQLRSIHGGNLPETGASYSYRPISPEEDLTNFVREFLAPMMPR